MSNLCLPVAALATWCTVILRLLCSGIFEQSMGPRKRVGIELGRQDTCWQNKIEIDS